MPVLQTSAKSPIMTPFPGWWLPNLFGYFLLFWPSSSEPSLDCLWEWRWRCPMEKGNRLQLFSALSLALCKLILAFSLYCPFYHWPDVSMKSLSSLQNASLLLWQFSLCTDSHVHLSARARCLSSLPQLPPASLTTLHLTVLSSSSSPSQDREVQAAAPKKTLGESMHWQFVTGSSFQQGLGCLKNILFWSLGHSYV